MAVTSNSGPLVTTGLIGGTNGGNNTSNQDAGPNVQFQGNAVFDLRYGYNKDNVLNGTIRSHFSNGSFVSTDAVPATLATNNIVAAAAVTSGTAMTLAAATSGIATAIPFQIFQTGTVATSGITLDYGFDKLNVTSGSVTATVANSAIYWVGMPLVVANVGNSAATVALLTYVTAIPSATTITLNTAPSATNAAAPVGTGNSWGPVGLAGNTLTPTFYQPYVAAGADLLWDPTQGVSRGIRISSAASGATGGTFTVTAYTEYGELQTILMTHAGGATTVWSKKTLKHIVSIVPNFTDSATYLVGTSDVFGFNMRNDKWEYTEMAWAGTYLSTNVGWTAADATSPATSGTGDVRGTIQIGANGPVTTGASGGASNGTSRLYISLNMPLYNMVRAIPSAPQTMYGVTPA